MNYSYTAHLLKKTHSICTVLSVLLTANLLTGLSLSSQSYATPIQAIVLAETDTTQSDLRVEQPLGMFALLLRHSGEQFEFSQQQVSYTRAWSDLNKLGNACMYNKFKSAEREQVAYFSQKPISIYPPLRLIVTKQNADKFPQPIDLSTYSEMNMHIGIVKGRSYGDSINRFIETNPNVFYYRSGMNSTQKLIEMLLKNRVTGVIEFSAEAHRILNDKDAHLAVHVVPIIGVTQPSYGYIACSKTPQGKQLIERIDFVMSQDAFKQDYIAAHNEFFDDDEKKLLKPELEKVFVD